VHISPRQTIGIVKLTAWSWRVWSLVVGYTGILAQACSFVCFDSKRRYVERQVMSRTSPQRLNRRDRRDLTGDMAEAGHDMSTELLLLRPSCTTTSAYDKPEQQTLIPEDCISFVPTGRGGSARTVITLTSQLDSANGN
jgi:hypothetical protein